MYGLEADVLQQCYTGHGSDGSISSHGLCADGQAAGDSTSWPCVASEPQWPAQRTSYRLHRAGGRGLPWSFPYCSPCRPSSCSPHLSPVLCECLLPATNGDSGLAAGARPPACACAAAGTGAAARSAISVRAGRGHRHARARQRAPARPLARPPACARPAGSRRGRGARPPEIERSGHRRALSLGHRSLARIEWRERNARPPACARPAGSQRGRGARPSVATGDGEERAPARPLARADREEGEKCEQREGMASRKGRREEGIYVSILGPV